MRQSRECAKDANYLGSEAKFLVEKPKENLGRIFKSAIRRLGENIEKPGQVNPRVLARIHSEGRFCEDALAAEYFGGLLASSRDSQGQDDRGLPILSVLKDLSVLEIRIHYIAYAAFRQALTKGARYKLDRLNSVFISVADFTTSLNREFNEQLNVVIEDSLDTLQRADLAGRATVWGAAEGVRYWTREIDEAGLLLTPTRFGTKLFLWAHGLPNAPTSAIADSEVQIELQSDVAIPPSKLVRRAPLPITA